MPCKVTNCAPSAWEDWGSCSVSCNGGQRLRSRSLAQLATRGGTGCNLTLSQAAPCGLQSCPKVDCLWGEWSDWSSCSCSCGGGERLRDRQIKNSPINNGAQCEPLTKEEVQPCNTHACRKPKCIDGDWDDWGPWKECSATCKIGFTLRQRQLRTEATSCGKPAEGLSRELAGCNTDIPCITSVDCELTSWSSWSACTDICSGVMRRTRAIKIRRSGMGNPCKGSLKQAAPCTTNTTKLRACKINNGWPIDCVMSDWDDWGSCSESCGGGQRVRDREVVTPSSHGGKACKGVMTETQPCKTQGCPSSCTPVDCRWTSWDSWSACDRGGEQRRYRHVASNPECGGKPCLQKAAEEVSNCTRISDKAIYCTWGDWEPYGECSATCGNALKSRMRFLKVTGSLLTNDLRYLKTSSPHHGFSPVQKSEDLRRRMQQIQTGRISSVILSFVCGFFSLVTAVATVQICSRRRDTYSYVAAPASLIE